MPKTLGLLIFIGIAAALLAAPSSRGRTDDAVKNAREVDLVTMAKVYAQNENRGHKAYRGRWVRVGATATRIGETLGTERVDTPMATLFFASHVSTAALDPGDRIEATCRVAGYSMGSVVLKECRP
jgi:DhnA family fructose-bisphosphate aldolase class Ia